MTKHWGAVLCLCCAWSWSWLSVAADKSGTGPSAISVPKGPGSIEGLGESFQPSLNSGTAKHSIPMVVPPGTAGHQPSLALAYEGGAGNGAFGWGWSLDLPHVRRRTDKGIPTYGVERVPGRTEDTFVNQGNEELVPVSQGSDLVYFNRNEGDFVRYRRQGDGWEGTLPDGTRMVFGQSNEARVSDPANPSRVYCWLLEKVTDLRNNTILFRYRGFEGENDLGQKYIEDIRYGPGAGPWTNYHFVRFVYETRPDVFEDGRPGFLIRTGRRLAEVLVCSHGASTIGHRTADFDGDGTEDSLNRRYVLRYETDPYWSLLGSVEVLGADDRTALPRARFGYTQCRNDRVLSARGRIIDAGRGLPAGLHTPGIEIVELNGDGLPDVVRTFSTGLQHRAYINQGMRIPDGAMPEISWSRVQGIETADGSAWDVDLAEADVLLADVDGDGLADLVRVSPFEGVSYFRNAPDSLGNLLVWGRRRLMARQDDMPPSPFLDPRARTADLDFDKRMDVVRSDGDVYHVWYSLGDDGFSERRTARPVDPYRLGDPGVLLTDFNGDRVPDLIRVTVRGVRVRAGLGYGDFADERSVPVEDGLASDRIAEVQLQDVDGNGLPDLILPRAEGRDLWFWPNLGNYSLGEKRVVSDIDAGGGEGSTIRWADLNGNGTVDYVVSDPNREPQVQMLDIGELLGCVPRPNLLNRIENGIGRVQSIRYETSTAFALRDGTSEDGIYRYPWEHPVPFPIDVVSETLTEDSLGHSYTTRFRYHDGYFDSAEKQFRGFARVEQIDVGDVSAPTLVTRSYFDTGREFEAMKGRLLRLTSEQEDGKVFVDMTTGWTVPPRRLHVGIDGREVHFVHPTKSVTLLRELDRGTPRRLESEFAYDAVGNRTLDANYGIVADGDRSAFDDERIVATEYAINLDRWILRTPSRTEVEDETGSVLSRAEMYYDDPTFSGNNFGIVTIGEMTLKREWTRPSSGTEYLATSRTLYDAYGNPTTILDPLAAAPRGAVDFGKGHGRVISYDPLFHTYPVLEVIHVGTGSEALVFKAAYDEGLGTVVSSTDFNGNQTTYGYDALGRTTSIVRPGDSPTFPTVEYDYRLAVPFGSAGLVNYVETRQLERTPGTAATRMDHYFVARQFVDGLGRKLLTKTEAEPESGTSAPRAVVDGATRFNARQEPFLVVNPYFSLARGSLDEVLAFESIEATDWKGNFQLEGALIALGLADAHATRSEYDATLRPTRVINPDASFRRTLYEPLVTRSYDENDVDAASPHFDTPMVHHKDGLGRLVRVDEIARLDDDGRSIGERRTWTTRYEYDLNDQLTRITDSQKNVKTFAYDGLRRKIGMNDPDRGVMTFVYDDASNLIETTDAKAQRITYTYDGANRILTEDYHDGRGPPSWRVPNPPLASLSRLSGDRLDEGLLAHGPSDTIDVLYHYDRPKPNLPQGDNTVATARNVKGALAWVEDLSGEEHSSYDARGRVDWVAKRIPDPLITNPTSLITYRTLFEYDSLDRITRLVYPDNDEIGYAYNARGLLDKIIGGGSSGLTASGCVLTNLAYWPSAQQQQVEYGNGVRTTYTHDSRLRLTEIFTRRQRDASELVHFGYEFDGVSNIRQITDRRPESAVPEGDPRRNTQIFRYDDLYRLTQAKYSFGLPGHPLRDDGRIDYRYDRIGNMMAQTSSFTNHVERGLPVADLGDMDSGGEAGRWNRAGRAANHPPGPHALTAIRHAQFPIRQYPYDANGNMTDIDGLKCAWDFKDRLIGLENDAMRAEYTYDYTDRRITKRVGWKVGAPDPDTPEAVLRSQRVITVSYPNKFFEVREHDAPTKYVWNGNTRVARITGSLSSNSRVQRLRLYPGWNLRSLAVSGSLAPVGGEGRFGVPKLPGEGGSEVLSVAFRWNPLTLTWVEVLPTDSLPPGTVLWLEASTNSILTVTGTYADPTIRTLTAGGDFLPSAGLETWDSKSTLSSLPGSTAWTYDALATHWLSWVPPPLEVQSDLPAFLAPGEVVFVRSDASTEVDMNRSTTRLLYYHGDHLGSCAITTGMEGTVRNEHGYYPFGGPRNASTLRQDEYTHTQKERDWGSWLTYVEARFIQTTLSRFLSQDPFLNNNPQNVLLSPQGLNAYSYVLQNPMKWIDSSGLAPALPDLIDTAKDAAAGNRVAAVGRLAIALLSHKPFVERLKALKPDPGFNATAEQVYAAKTGANRRIESTSAKGANVLAVGLLAIAVATAVADNVVGVSKEEVDMNRLLGDLLGALGAEGVDKVVLGVEGFLTGGADNREVNALMKQGFSGLVETGTFGINSLINNVLKGGYAFFDVSEDRRFMMDVNVAFEFWTTAPAEWLANVLHY